jgi:hypothetical protein
MKVIEVNSLLRVGAYDRLRKKLKRMAIPERIDSLNDSFHLIDMDPGSLKFFKENFSVEIGALIVAERDLKKAVELYSKSKKLNK